MSGTGQNVCRLERDLLSRWRSVCCCSTFRAFLSFVAWVCFPVLTSADHFAAGSASTSLDRERLAAKTAEQFFQAWSQKDARKLQPMLEFPFRFYFPCGNAPACTWQDWEDRWFPRAPQRGNWRVEKVLTLETFVRSGGGSEQDVARFREDVGGNVVVVAIGGLAVYVRAGPDKPRIIGMGVWWPPTTKP
jgi:hypothetical protein